VGVGPSRIGYNRWNPAKNEIEFMRLGEHSPAPRYQVTATFDVVFEGVHPLSSQPVIPTLRAIATEVENVISAIEAETIQIVELRGHGAAA
jgi:hypothetical protein